MNDNTNIEWPQKTREMHDHHLDSTRWNDFQFRDNDIVISTWAKSGTTWMQQILGQLIFDAAEGIPVMDLSPWVDFRTVPKDDMLAMVEAQTHRRFLKTHLPVESIVYSPKAKYIFIGRDGRDSLWSWHHHHLNMTAEGIAGINNAPNRIGPPLAPAKEDIVEYFNDWLDGDGFPVWPFFSHIQSWWNIRELPNIHFVHFNELKADLAGCIREIARFLEIEIDESLFPSIVEHCTFDYMKSHGDDLTPRLSVVFNGGGKAFVNKGTNARWKDILSAKDLKKYNDVVARELSPDCAHWLEFGNKI